MPRTKALPAPIRKVRRQLQKIADEGDKDRVSALRAIIDIHNLAQDHSGSVPQLNDEEAQFDALCRVISAAGRALTERAVEKVFPPRDILLEAQNETETHLAGPAPS